MNILGHFSLSGTSPATLFGNFIGDFVDEELASTYSQEIYRGIVLHRHIDRFTNEHERFKQSKKLLWQRHRHYSAVIVDIFYDHFLAHNWERYSALPLEEFADQCYGTITQFQELLPPKAKGVVPHLIAHNWLVKYRTIEGIDRSLRGMARRATFPTKMDSAVQDLQRNYTSFADDFARFMPEIQRYCDNLLTM